MYIGVLKPQNSIKIVDIDEREFFEMKKNVNLIFLSYTPYAYFYTIFPNNNEIFRFPYIFLLNL